MRCHAGASVHSNDRAKCDNARDDDRNLEPMADLTAEVVVVGGGPAGLTAPVARAGTGVETALGAAPHSGRDQRTTALLAGSVMALDALGVWARCREHAAPLRVLRIVDDTARLWRAPEVAFAASEIGLDAFGHNVENRFLIAALEARAAELPALTRVAAVADGVEVADERVTVRCGDTAVSARLALGTHR